MNQKPNNTRLYWLGCSGVFLVSFLIFWGWNNVQSQIERAQSDLTKLARQSYVANATYKNNLNDIVELQKDITANKFIEDTIKKSVDKIFYQWKESQKPIDTADKNFTFVIDRLAFTYAYKESVKWNQFIAAVAIPLLFGWFLYLIIFTSILRDAVSDAAKKSIAPYSLSRTQLAFWIFIIATLYIYSVLWDQADIMKINQTVLILMGISAGTFAAGAVLDTNEIEQGVKPKKDDDSSEGFLKDIVSDKQGISIHRFQNVVWTIVAILIYCYRYNNPPNGIVVLPELDQTLLALTGISSATYLTMKTRENAPAAGDKNKPSGGGGNGGDGGNGGNGGGGNAGDGGNGGNNGDGGNNGNGGDGGNGVAPVNNNANNLQGQAQAPVVQQPQGPLQNTIVQNPAVQVNVVQNPPTQNTLIVNTPGQNPPDQGAQAPPADNASVQEPSDKHPATEDGEGQDIAASGSETEKDAEIKEDASDEDKSSASDDASKRS